ncbi:MAG TPA: DUF4870 domain-containing protein [Rubrobacter sp.]|nr:DUF4870 domain-containing protein [Rubrobacter sp.]
MAEEQRNYGMEPNSERSDPGRPDSEGREAGETRLRRIRTTTAATSTSSVSPQDEKTWSILAHVSVFLNLFTGFLGPVGAFIIWLMYKDSSPRISFHALQSLWYQVAWIVILAVGWTITGILTAIIIGFLLIPVMIVASVVPFVHMGYAAYKVSQGVHYRYPIIADMIDGNRTNETL